MSDGPEYKVGTIVRVESGNEYPVVGFEQGGRTLQLPTGPGGATREFFRDEVEHVENVPASRLYYIGRQHERDEERDEKQSDGIDWNVSDHLRAAASELEDARSHIRQAKEKAPCEDFRDIFERSYETTGGLIQVARDMMVHAQLWEKSDELDAKDVIDIQEDTNE